MAAAAALAVALAAGALALVAAYGPFSAFQRFGQTTFCGGDGRGAPASDAERALFRALRLASPAWGAQPPPAPLPDWCGAVALARTSMDAGDGADANALSLLGALRAVAAAPSLYAHVQRAYWGVGLFAFWKVAHLGNFALAAPALLLAAAFGTGALRAPDAAEGLAALTALVRCAAWADKGAAAGAGAAGGTAAFAVSAAALPRTLALLPYRLHALALALVCAVFAHVHVSTRLLASASPAIYWLAADVVVRARGGGQALLLVCVWQSYALVGAVLFSLHYNWT